MSLSLETIDFLKRTTLFARVTEQQLQEIAQIGEEVSFNVGDILIRQDGLTDQLFVILDGQVEIEIVDASKIGVRGPKSVLGELAMITQSPRNANCTAVTPVRTARFKHKPFWEFVEREPSLAIGLLTEVIYHLDETIDTLYWMSREVRELRAALDKLKK